MSRLAILPAAALLLVTACSSGTTPVTPTPGEDAGIDAEVPAEDAAPTAKVPPLGVCDATHECDDQGVCLTLPGAKVGYCGRKCTSNSACTDSPSFDDSKCTDVGGGDKACVYTCIFSEYCPTKLACASFGGCVPNCKKNPGVCGSKFVCTASGTCGDPPPPPCTPTATSGIAPTTSIKNFTGPEKATFCDWQACQLGGYGTTITCDSGIAANPPANQQACTSKAVPSACTATVAQMEACAKVIASQRCAPAAALASAECQAVKSCF